VGFKINNKNYIIMKTDYRFWEQNFNPITMRPDDKKNYSSSWDLEEMDKSQKKREAIQERQAIREAKKLSKDKVKRVGKFW
jgi:hypothetical protein